MSDDARRRAAVTDLEPALRSLGAAIDWPATGGVPARPDLAARVRARLGEDAMSRRDTRGLWRPRWSPARRALVLALVALVVLAAVATAIRLGVPGITIEFGAPGSGAPAPPGPTLGPTSGPSDRSPAPPGADLGLGDPVGVDEVGARAGIELRLPPASVVGGPPDAAYVNRAGVASLVWAPSSELPATREPGVGLLLTAFEGRVGPDAIRKIADTGTAVERLTIGGRGAYWLTGDPHYFYFLDADGAVVDSTRRWVGDALIWSDGTVTYRLETALGREAAVRIAESIE